MAVTDDLLAELPDIPRWVELRSALLRGDARVFGDAKACVAVDADASGGLVIAVGFPEARYFREAARIAPNAEVLVMPEGRSHAEAIAGRMAMRAVLHRLDEGPPVERRVRTALVKADQRQLQHARIDEALREELLGVETEMMIAYAGDEPAAFCYAGSITESLWDISIDTAPAHRRRGYAGAAVRAMIDIMRPRAPVWCALEDNAASMRLATKLGFREMDALYILPAEAFLNRALAT